MTKKETTKLVTRLKETIMLLVEANENFEREYQYIMYSLYGSDSSVDQTLEFINNKLSKGGE